VENGKGQNRLVVTSIRLGKGNEGIKYHRFVVWDIGKVPPYPSVYPPLAEV
jgi:hypothetical protein